MGKHRIFVSSVQKEMESERLAIASLISGEQISASSLTLAAELVEAARE